MHNLGQALQTFNQARAWTLNDVYVDMVYLVRFDRVNMAPVSAFVDQVDISAVGRVLGENDVLRVCTDHRFIADRGIATITAIRDRKSTRLNSSHLVISYAGF